MHDLAKLLNIAGLGRIQDHEPLPFLLVRHRGDGQHLGRFPERAVIGFLHADVRHHLAPDLAEAREAVGDRHEPVLVHDRDVAGVVPSVAQHLRGLLRVVEIADHDVRPLDEHQPGLAGRNPLAGLRVHGFDRDAGQGMAHAAEANAGLPDAVDLDIRDAERRHRREFRRAVAFERADAELFLERVGHARLELLRADDDVAQRREVLGFRAPQVRQQERRCREKKRGAVLAHDLRDLRAIERVRMVGGRESAQQRQPQRAGEPERVKERERGADVVRRREPEHGADRFHVGQDVVMAQHHTLRRARRTR
ncbi:MAG: hypothetical protein BWY59_01709 [Verrucomicrobia bacterium ADurb.Bin345]|nr:MAG: hypothetical protein BWY59_01709 [Verrucomicrobia bacterium ADurb.Bin345]